MTKKLIFVTEALWIGGIETALVNLLNHLDYKKYDVTCLILCDEQQMAERITRKCRLLVADRQKPVSFPKAYKYRRIFNLMEEPQNASSIRRMLWRVLCFLLRAPEACLYASYLRKQLHEEHFDTAVIYSDRTAETAVRAVNADNFLMFYHHGGMRKVYHDFLGYKKSRRIIAVSGKQAEELRAFRPAYADKIIAINNLTDIEAVREKSQLTPEFVFPKEQINLVSCGRLAVEKGFDLALNACDILRKQELPLFHWWIIGGGPEEKTLLKYAHENNLTPYITFLGMQSNPYQYIVQGDIYVQPSRIEGHPLTVLEAQVLGRPILATRTDGSTAILIHKQTGMLCDVTAQSIADGVCELIKNIKLRETLAVNVSAIDFEAQNDMILGQLYREFD